MMDRTLFVHLGPPKTGTTAVQRFFRSNDTLLSEKGYHYIKTLRWKIDGSHTPLAWILLHKHSHFYADTESIPYVADKDRFLGALADEIGGISGKSMILSSEVFPFLSGEASGELLGLFPDVPVKVIFYVRDLREQYLSFASQLVKFQNNRTCDDRLSHVDINHVIPLFRHWYTDCLGWWEQRIGKENMIFRKYGAEYLKNGSIYADIMDAMGLELTKDFVWPESLQNESLRYCESIYFKDLLNRLPLKTPQSELEKKLLSWEKSNKGTEFYLPACVSEGIEEGFAGIRDHLRERYLDETYDGFFDKPVSSDGKKDYRLSCSHLATMLDYMDSGIPGFKDDFVESLTKVLDRNYMNELRHRGFEDNVAGLIPATGEVVLWGCGDVARRLFEETDFFSGGRFHIVDKNIAGQGGYFRDRKVQPPSVIEEKGIDTVIITTVAYGDEIGREIAERHPGVRHIIRLTDIAGCIGAERIDLGPDHAPQAMGLGAARDGGTGDGRNAAGTEPASIQMCMRTS